MDTQSERIIYLLQQKMLLNLEINDFFKYCLLRFFNLFSRVLHTPFGTIFFEHYI